MTEPQPRPPGGRRVTAVAVQTGPTSGDLDEDLRTAGELARGAGVRQALVVFPELFSRPFWCLGMSDPRYLSWAEPARRADGQLRR